MEVRKPGRPKSPNPKTSVVVVHMTPEMLTSVLEQVQSREKESAPDYFRWLHLQHIQKEPSR